MTASLFPSRISPFFVFVVGKDYRKLTNNISSVVMIENPLTAIRTTPSNPLLTHAFFLRLRSLIHWNSKKKKLSELYANFNLVSLETHILFWNNKDSGVLFSLILTNRPKLVAVQGKYSKGKVRCSAKLCFLRLGAKAAAIFLGRA